MIVCIAEKPSVALEIAKILGASQRKDGYFEGNGYQVTWTFGHLCMLKSPEDYKDIWKKWQLLQKYQKILLKMFSLKLLGS